ncbi:hypothetical protein ANO11243_009620 [Dothideomycetidae sp. 11243]|nr:hypothetical protein ANO11243_009620 [fungal sp. No.11243]
MASINFVTHHKDFAAILGSSPRSAQLLAVDESADPQQLYHEACVYHAPSKSVFVTSNQIKTSRTTHTDNGKEVKLFRIHDSQTGRARVEDITPPALADSMLNGGVNFGPSSLLMCAQGSSDPEDLSGLIALTLDDSASPKSTFSSITPVVTSFHGKPFNSVNDVVIDPVDGAIWFTDPCYGYHQQCRPAPQLPNQVYRFDPRTKSIRAVADGFSRPNGICFSPDAKVVYITDTGAIHGAANVPVDTAGPSHIYAFDVQRTDKGGVFLANRRLFAYAPGMFPDGIKCDMNGNVYSGCGDGIEVWSPDGMLLGTIEVPGGVANFCFGEEGDVFICNETKFFKVKLEGARGALLGI